MKICTRCLYCSDHPLHLTFDEEGVCSGCRIHEEKDQLDWCERSLLLERIFNDYRDKSGRNYDCIIPISGARDSYFTVHVVKNVYRMNPLLVTYNKHYNTAIGVRNLANLRVRFNCDMMTLTVSPETVKKITRSTLRRFGSVYWHCLAGQTVYPVQVAVMLKVPLIVWGLHQGIDQVGMFSHKDEVEMTRKYRKEHDLMGFEAEDLIDDFDNITESDVSQFVYPTNKQIEQVGVRGIYLNNYIRWDSRKQHEQMIREQGYLSAEQHRTFDRYNDIDCWVYSDVHDYIKWLKHGYGKVLDHTCREIRLRRLTRRQGVALVKKYRSRRLQNLNLFLTWLGVTKDAFRYIVDQHRNPNIWIRDGKWNWRMKSDFLRIDTQAPLDDEGLGIVEPHTDFILTNNINYVDNNKKYILIGKGMA